MRFLRYRREVCQLAAYVIGETENNKSEILNGKFQIIFISPELLLTNLNPPPPPPPPPPQGKHLMREM